MTHLNCFTAGLHICRKCRIVTRAKLKYFNGFTGLRFHRSCNKASRPMSKAYSHLQQLAVLRLRAVSRCSRSVVQSPCFMKQTCISPRESWDGLCVDKHFNILYLSSDKWWACFTYISRLFLQHLKHMHVTHTWPSMTHIHLSFMLPKLHPQQPIKKEPGVEKMRVSGWF